MVIMKMNNMLMKHSRILFGIFTVVIIVSFVWFFTPGMDGSIFFGNHVNSSSVIGKVFGEKVRQGELVKQTLGRCAAFSARTGGGNPQRFMTEEMIRNSFPYYASLLTAKELGIQISDGALMKKIQNDFALFQVNGKFDLPAYQKFVRESLAPANLTARDLEEAIRSEMTVAELEEVMASTTVATPGEIEVMLDYALGKTDFKLVQFMDSDFIKNVTATEQEALDFHKANGNLFMTQPSVDAVIVPFMVSDFIKNVKITQDDIKNYYELNKDQYKKDGKVQPLSAVSAKISATLQHDVANTLASNAAKKIRKGLYDLSETPEYAVNPKESIAKYLKENNCRTIRVERVFPSTKALNEIGPEKALIAALFTLTPEKNITKTISGNNGAFIGMLTGQVASQPAPFAEVKETVVSTLKQAKAAKLAQEASANLALKLSESKNPAKELSALAKSCGGKVTEIKGANLFSEMKTPVDRYAYSVAAETSTGALSESKMIPGGAMMVYVAGRSAPDAKQLENFKPMLEAGVAKEKANQAKLLTNYWIYRNAVSYMKDPDQQR